jgi:hypothetical protein
MHVTEAVNDAGSVGDMSFCPLTWALVSLNAFCLRDRSCPCFDARSCDSPRKTFHLGVGGDAELVFRLGIELATPGESAWGVCGKCRAFVIERVFRDVVIEATALLRPRVQPYIASLIQQHLSEQC